MTDRITDLEAEVARLRAYAERVREYTLGRPGMTAEITERHRELSRGAQCDACAIGMHDGREQRHDCAAQRYGIETEIAQAIADAEEQGERYTLARLSVTMAREREERDDAIAWRERHGPVLDAAQVWAAARQVELDAVTDDGFAALSSAADTAEDDLLAAIQDMP